LILTQYKAASVEHQGKMCSILRWTGGQSIQSSTVSSRVQECSTIPVILPKPILKSHFDQEFSLALALANKNNTTTTNEKNFYFTPELEVRMFF